MWTRAAALLLGLVFGLPSAAGDAGDRADVLAVRVQGQPRAYRFQVTLRSPDVDCTRYANWWEVVRSDGSLVYRRVLMHSHPGEQPFPVVATCDYMKAVPDQIARWVPAGYYALGTDGFGRSEVRQQLRDYFEVDRRYVAIAALRELARAGQFDESKLGAAAKTLELDPDKLDPAAAPKPGTLGDG